LAEIARINAEQAKTVAQTEADKVIQTATIARDGAVQTAAIERDRNIELARITTAVQTAQKSEEESTATAAANEARALAARAEESVLTAKAMEIANRTKNVAVIAATQRAQEEAVQITVAATADKEAAEARAAAMRTEATAEADAEKVRAEGRAVAFKVDAAGQTALNEATNILNDTQTALLVRKAMLEALPAIIAAASKPMEQIDKISILDARGLHGDNGGADGAGANGNLADAAVAAAMRYRVGGPLIDALMSELGMTGGNLNGMLAGAPPQPTTPAPDKGE
jgi:flotillin